MADDGSVKVFCRVRPPNEREGGATSSYVKKCVAVPSSDPLQQTVLVQLKGTGAQAAPKTFTFDRVFSEMSSQDEVFEIVGVPITKACLEGYNGTIFAYGQTGSGKTFTMQGPDDVIDTEARRLTEAELGLRGVVPRVFDYLFKDSSTRGALRVPTDGSQSAAPTKVEHTFACSFMEIYNERVYDLLDLGSTRDAAGLILRENGRKGVFVEGLIESVVTNAKQAAELMAVGARHRRVGQTAMNRESSRSHSVFVLQIQSKETTADGITRTRLSRFNLVDLAGSERQKNTEAAGDRLKEAGSINKSLSALGNVIMGLVEQSSGKNRHVHYRDSKLTFLLKDSLGGNSKTFMIATVSPAEDSSHETLSTLKFAQRAKLIRNNAVINENTSGSVLVLQEEILRLRRQLQEARSSQGHQLVQEARFAASAVDGGPDQEGHSSIEISERVIELESALAYSLEKNDELQRCQGRLVVQSGHLQRICSDLKKTVSHLKLRLRLQTPADDDVEMDECEPSADAIEWRMKYEELEERLMEIQQRLPTSTAGEKSAELVNLQTMYFTLTKQLAALIREKHDLADRVVNEDSPRSDDSFDKVAQLEQELHDQSVEFEAQLRSVLQVRDAAEGKAQFTALELLSSKQKEASWTVMSQDKELQIADLRSRLEEAQIDIRRWKDSSIEEQRHRLEIETTLRSELATAQHTFEESLADKLTENFELRRRVQETEAHLARVIAERDDIKSALTLAHQQNETQRQDIVNLEESVLSIKNNAAVQVQQLMELEASKLTLANALEETTCLLDKESSDLSQAKLELKATTEELSRSRVETDRLHSNAAALERTNEELLERIHAVEAEVSESVSRLHAAEEAVRTSEGKLAERTRQHEAAMADAKNDLDGLQSQRAATVAKSNEQIAQLTALHQDEVTSMQRVLEDTTRQYETRLSKLQRELEEAGSKARHAAERHEEQVAKLQDEIRELSRQLQSEEDEHAKRMQLAEDRLAEVSRSHEDEVERLNVELGASVSKLSAAQEAISEMKSQAEERERELVDKNEACDRLQKELEDAQEESTEHRVRLSGQVQLLESSLADLRRTHDVLLSSHQSLTTEHAQLARDKQKVEDHSRTQALRIAELTKSLEDAQSHATTLAASVSKLEAQLKQLVGETARVTGENHQALAALREELSRRDEAIDEKDSVISGMEETVENLEVANAQTRQQVESLSAKLQAVETERLHALEALKKAESKYTSTVQQYELTETQLKNQLSSNTLDMAAAKNMISSQQNQIEDSASQIATLNSQLSELSTANDALKNRIAESKRAAEEKLSQHTSELATLSAKEAKLKEEVAGLRTALQETERQLKTATEDSITTEKAVERDLQQLRLELEHAVERATRLRKKNETLQEVNDQLTVETKAASARATRSDERVSGLESELVTAQAKAKSSDEALAQKTASLAATMSELQELAKMHTELLKEVATVKTDFDAKLAMWELKDKELKGRSSVVETMEVQVADESKKLADEKVALAQKRKEVEKILKEYREQKTRLEELETLKIQLQKEKEKYRREANILNVRLEEALKAKDELVGHHNKRQKIQHHIKVKEENNKLLEEMKQLTDDKFRLEVRVKKLEHMLKEKENLASDSVLAVLDETKSQASVQSAISSSSLKAQPAAAMQDSTLGLLDTAAPKRMRSRIE